MTTLQDRLHGFLDYKNIAMQIFERKCNIGQGLGAKLSTKSYNTTFNRIAAAFPELNINWLKTGEGEMLNPTGSVEIDVDLKFGSHGQLALGDINNIGDAKVQILLLQERLKQKDKDLKKYESEIAELKVKIISLENKIGDKDAQIARLTDAIIGNTYPVVRDGSEKTDS